jgi:site-specific DNA-methyltransferase (adenine-specific)
MLTPATMNDYQILQGDCLASLKLLASDSIDCCVTSPPYFGLRDYGCDGQIGLEETPDAFIARLVDVFREVRRVLKHEGTCWVNMGDSYSGSGKGPAGNLGKEHDERNMEKIHSAIIPAGTKPKDLIGIPWMLAFALRADGWYLRQDIIWHKPNPMPESVTDRCTKAHEYIFLLSKSKQYYFDHIAMQEPAVCAGQKRGVSKNVSPNGVSDFGGKIKYDTRNKRSVWSVNTKSYREAHFATYPPALIEPCILAGCPEGGVVLDPFGGSGTTAEVAIRNRRKSILCELNPDYIAIINKRLACIEPTLAI